MKIISTTIALAFVLTLFSALGFAEDTSEKIINSDFSKGDFAALGWKVDGGWDTMAYNGPGNTSGTAARFKAKEPDGSLSKTFTEVKDPQKLELSIDVGWGWGAVNQAADKSSFMLLDTKGNGYVFEIHRTKAKWAVQWAKVHNRVVPKDKNFAPEDIDCTIQSVKNDGGLEHLTITRESSGAWTFQSKAWNKGAGDSVKFNDTTTTSFSELVIIGSKNFDEQFYANVVLEAKK